MVTATKPYTASNIIGIVGPKRNNKSLLLAYTLIQKLIEGEAVWSNMPVHTGEVVLARRYSPSGKPIKYAETKPLDYDLFYRLDSSFVNGTVAIDEIGYIANSRQSNDTRNKLINMVVRQAGHRSLDLVYTDRSFYRVDYRIREETDILIEAQDLSFTPWGRQNSIAGGTMACYKYFDISGAATGKSCYNGRYYDPSAYYMEKNFYGKPYWDCYDTREVISLEEACTGISLEMRKRHIGNDHREEEKLETSGRIASAIAELKKKGKILIPTNIFWRFARDNFDVEGNSNNLARLLPEGVERKRTKDNYLYDFSNAAA